MKQLIAYVIAVVVFLSPILLILMLSDTSQQLRDTHSPTRYEYPVVSVERTQDFFGNNFYVVTYLEDVALTTTTFNTRGELYLVKSNKSILVLENPELNGYPKKWTLYWEFKGDTK